MRCVVSGAYGFLGRHLCKALEARGDEVTRIRSSMCDLTKENTLNSLTSCFDQIFHLAAWTEAGDFCLEHSGDQWLINQQINTSVLKWWKEKQPQAKLIAIGSSCSYEPGPDRKESEYMSGEPHESLYAYAMTKRMLYEGCRSLARQYGLKYLYVIPSAIYGADYHTDSRKAHFIFDVTKKIIRGQELGEPVSLWGDGSQWREVVHTDDFVNVLLKLNESHENDIFNIGSGDNHTIRYFAQKICEIVGYDHSKIKYDITKYVGSKVKYLSADKMHKAVPDYATVPLETGLKAMIGWYYASGAWRV